MALRRLQICGWALLLGALAAIFGGGFTAADQSADLQTAPAVLLLIEDRSCPYWARWNRHVRQSYLNSEEGRFAPLVRRFRGSADVAFIPDVIYSPTFVVLVRGREVGRIVGYQGADFFWADLAGLLVRAGFKRGDAQA